MREELSAEDRERMRKEYLEKASQSFDEMFGKDGYNGLVTFVQKDDRACEAVDKLWEWMMEKHIELDEGMEAEEIKRRCPRCGKLARLRKGEEAEGLEIREVVGRRGGVEFGREGCYCGHCRVVFFPSGPTDGDWDGRLQSQDS